MKPRKISADMYFSVGVTLISHTKVFQIYVCPEYCLSGSARALIDALIHVRQSLIDSEA